MTILPKFEALEDRIVLDAEPTVTIDGDATVDLGAQGVEYTLTFDNTGTESGYAPYIDLVLPTTGSDGDDGITFGSASYLGASVSTQSITFDSSGEAEHPYAVDASGNPLVISGTPGDTLVVLQLPFGSFSPGNPAADVKVKLNFSELADLDKPLAIKATGGFSLGKTALNDPTAGDPSIVSTAPAEQTISPRLFEIIKTNTMPESEGATGPSYVYKHNISVRVAPGQTLTDFVLTDTLPHDIIYRGGLSAPGGTIITQPNDGDRIGPGNDKIEIKFASITGSKAVSFDFHIPDKLADGTPILNGATGDPKTMVNHVAGQGEWNPIDPRDAARTITGSTTNSFEASSLAIQKDGKRTIDADGDGKLSIGDTMTFTLDVQISDYFSYGDLKVSDILGNGWQFVAGSAKLTTQQDGSSITTPLDLTPHQSSAAAGAGQTKLIWDISAALGGNGVVQGSAVDSHSGTGQTTMKITYKAKVGATLADTGGANQIDTNVGQGDLLTNTVNISASVRDNDNTSVVKDNERERDESSHEERLDVGKIKSKSIYAVNNVLVTGGTPTIAAGDVITWKIVYDAPSDSFNKLRIQDNLPLGIFRVSELTDGWIESPVQAIPDAGKAQFGTGNTFSGTIDPALVLDTYNNQVTFKVNSLTNPTGTSSKIIEILFSVTVQDAKFADELLLTNQATAFEQNSFGEEVSSAAIAQFVYAEPVLGITKGVVAHSSTDSSAGFTKEGDFDTSASAGPVTFTAPGSAGTRFAGTISSTALKATPIDADLRDVDAGDTVTFAIVIENTGKAPNGAFNVKLHDALPSWAEAPSGGHNLRVTDGAGNLIGHTGSLFDPANPLELTDAANKGAIATYDETSGKNIIIITYDVKVKGNVYSKQSLANEVTLESYTAFEGTPSNVAKDRADPDLTDVANILIEPVEVTKKLVGREIGNDGVLSDNQVRIGEEFTTRLRFDIPEGVHPNITIEDLVRSDGTYDKFEILSAKIVTWGAAMSSDVVGMGMGSSGSVASDGGSVSFNLGTLTNTPDNITSNDFIEIDVVARSVGTGASPNGYGDTLGDTATVKSGADELGTASAEVRVAESNVQIAKTAMPITPAAGGEVTYTVTITNPSRAMDAPAYDLVLTDAIPADVDLTAGQVVVKLNGVDRTADLLTKGNGATDTEIELKLTKLNPNDVLIVTYKGKLNDNLETGKTVTNTAALIYDSMPGSDDAQKVYNKSDTADVTLVKPKVDKTITGTSLGATSGSDLAIGETITYQIKLTIPEGTASNVVLKDVLPQNGINGSGGTLSYVSSKVVRISDGTTITGSALAVGASGSHAGGTVTFDFGTLTNPVNGTTDSADEIIVEVVARLDDLAPNASGDTLINKATLTTNLIPAGISDTATAKIVEPKLDLAKTSSVTKADAGDVIPYKITSKNTGAGPAYDIKISDSLSDAGIAALGSGSPSIRIMQGSTDVTPTGADAPSLTYPTGSGGVEAVIPVLLPGQHIEITFDAQVTDAAKFSSPIKNTAQIDRYDTDPAGGVNDANGRVYSTGLPSASHTLTTPDLTLTKEYLSSSDDNTAGKKLTIGETVTYELTMTLPEGEGDLVLTDALPAGLKAISAKVTGMGAASASKLALNDTDANANLALSDHQVVFNFGKVTVAGDNDAAAGGHKITVTVTAQVEDDTALVSNGKTLKNTATLEVRDPANLASKLQTVSASETISIVEPKLSIDKTGQIAANPGDTVPYKLTIKNDGSGPAYDIKVEDVLGNDKLSLTGTPVFKIDNDPDTPQPAITALDDGFFAIVSQLLPGQELTVDYTATLAGSAAKAQSYPNTATITYDTIKDNNPQTVPGRDYTASDTFSVGTVPHLTKVVTKTSLSETGDADSDGKPDVNVGETVTYTLTLTLPEVAMDSVILKDKLPAGMDFVSAKVVHLGADGTITSSGLAAGDTDTSSTEIAYDATSRTTTLDFGSVTNPSDGSIGADDEIKVEITARVSNASTTSPVSGDPLENTATLDVTAGGIALDQATAAATVEVVEPVLVATKTGPKAADRGSDVPYVVTVKNTGNGPAFDVTIKDLLADADLALSGSVVVKLNGAVITPAIDTSDGFSFDIAKLMPNDEIKVTYKATLAAGSGVAKAHTNTVQVAYDSLPGDNALDRDSSATASHTVSAEAGLSKTVSGTSDTLTDKAKHDATIDDVMVGETITYDLVLTLPEITMDRVELTDTLPAGLRFVSASLETGGLNDDGAGGARFTLESSTSGQTQTFLLKSGSTSYTISNPSDGSIGADDKITIKVKAVVTDDAAHVKNANKLENTATLQITPDGESALKKVEAKAKVEIVEPKVTLKKAGPIAAAPGQVVEYTLTLKNEGSGPAYDLALKDLLANAHLTLKNTASDPILYSIYGSDITTTYSSSNGFSATIPVLKPGETLTVTYKATLSSSAPEATTFPNTASVSYDTVKGANPSDVRVFSTEDSHGVSTVPHVEKTIASTSVSETGKDKLDGAIEDVAIGETITYHLDFYLPEGASLTDVTLKDKLPAGLDFVSAKVVHLGADGTITSTGLAAGATDTSSAKIAHDATSRTTTFDFGAVTNPFDGSESAGDSTIGPNDFIRVEYVAKVRDKIGGTEQAQGAPLENTATGSITFADGTTLTATGSKKAEIVTPDLKLGKSGPIGADPGDLVKYELVLENKGKGPAFDVTLSDALAHADLKLRAGSVKVYKNGTEITPALSSVTTGGTADGFSFTLAKLLPDDKITVTYSADFDAGAAPAARFDNTAKVSYDTLPGGDPATDGARALSAEKSHALYSNPTVAKSIASSSDGNTGTGQHTGLTDLTIGEEVTFHLTVALPEIALKDVTLKDTLPPGMKFVSASIARSGIAGVSLSTAQDASDPQKLTLSLGAVDNSGADTQPNAADDEVVIAVKAVVTKDAANINAKKLTNNVTLDVTRTDDTSYDTRSDSASIEIVEPDLSIKKTAPDGVTRGGALSYGLEIRNDGTGPAYDIAITDLLGSDKLSMTGTPSFKIGTTAANATAVTPTSSGTSGTGFEAVIAKLLPGETIFVTYQAKLAADAEQAHSYPNTAKIAYDTVAGANPANVRSYTGETTATLATDPKLTKQAIATDWAETGSDQNDPALIDANIGETVTYRLALTLPDTTLTSVQLKDNLPAGMKFVSAKVISMGSDGSMTSSTGLAAGTTDSHGSISHDSASRVTTFDFGKVVNPFETGESIAASDIGAQDVIIVEYKAKVVSKAGAITSSGAPQLQNDARLDITFADGVKLSDTASARIDVVEPNLVMAKSGSRAVNPGEAADYTLQISNTGTGAAFDAVISDALDNANLSLVSGSVKITIDGVQQSLAVVETGSGFSLTVPALKAGSTAIVTYKATLAEDAAPVQSYLNEAKVDYDNVKGGGDPALEETKTASDSHYTATIPTLTKTAISGDNPDSGSGHHDPALLDAALGEIVTYELVLTLPEIEMDQLILTDRLPAGLEYRGFEVVSKGAGITAGAPVLAQSKVGGQDEIRLSFGAVSNAFDGSIGADDKIVMRVNAQVVDTDALRDGLRLTNEAGLTVTPKDEAALETQTARATIEIVEPDVSVVKSVDNAGPMLGDIITYTLKIRNAPGATLTGYQNIVTDTLPEGVLLDGAVTFSDPDRAHLIGGSVAGKSQLVFQIPRLEPGEEITVSYQARVLYTAEVLTALDNQVSVKTDRHYPGSGDFRPDISSASATIVADPVPEEQSQERRIPHLGIDDAQFIPVVTIDPIFTGTAEPGASVTINLYKDNGALAFSQHILADAGGHWIALFPRVGFEDVRGDFWSFYDGSRLFQKPVELLDTGLREGLGFTDDMRRADAQTSLKDEAFFITASADRPSILPLESGSYSTQTSYAPGQNRGAFASAETRLDVDDIFGDIAAKTVDRLYQSSANPLAHGMNRFNHEFMQSATSVVGGQ